MSKNVSMRGISLKDTKDETYFVVKVEIKLDTLEEASDCAKVIEQKIQNMLDNQTTLEEQ